MPWISLRDIGKGPRCNTRGMRLEANRSHGVTQGRFPEEHEILGEDGETAFDKSD